MNVLGDPAFRIYAVCTVVLVVKMFFVSIWTAMTRSRLKKFMNPEDAILMGAPGGTVTEEDPAVARVLRVHRNDFENVFPFLFIALIYALGGASERGALIYMGTFTVTRVAHTFSYLKGMQPARAILWFIGLACILGMMVSILMRVF